MTDFSPAELAFLEAADSAVSVKCLCQFSNHGGTYCGEPAAVTIKMHLPHHCQRPDLRAQGIIDTDGNVTQILCSGCYKEARDFCEAKIAQTHAICQQLSCTCQGCNFPLAHYSQGVLGLHDVCPRCSAERIVFQPVCGAGRAAHGCGADLNIYTDIIRGEEWM